MIAWEGIADENDDEDTASFILNNLTEGSKPEERNLTITLVDHREPGDPRMRVKVAIRPAVASEDGQVVMVEANELVSSLQASMGFIYGKYVNIYLTSKSDHIYIIPTTGPARLATRSDDGEESAAYELFAQLDDRKEYECASVRLEFFKGSLDVHILKVTPLHATHLKSAP
jgi:hypothetical protein